MTVMVVLIAMALGLILRLCWARVVTEGKVYRVPLFWVAILFAIVIATTPKTTAFIIGIFAVDLIGAYVKSNEDHKKAWKEFLDWAMKLIPLKSQEKNDKST